MPEQDKSKSILDRLKNFFSSSIPSAENQNIDMVNIPSEEVAIKEPESDFYPEEDYTSYAFDPQYGNIEVIEYVPEDPFPRMGEPGVDHSLMTLKYLLSLGYKKCYWFLDERHTKHSNDDPCEYNQNKEFNIPDIIDYAYTHAQGGPKLDGSGNPKKPKEMKEVTPYGEIQYNLPAMRKPYSDISPIYAMSHPDCICHLYCIDPLNINDIPDNAPGMPMFGDEILKQKYKQIIMDNILAIPEGGIEIHAYTLPPSTNFIEEFILGEGSTYKNKEILQDIYTRQQNQPLESEASIKSDLKIKQANWVTNIKPIRIKNNCYMQYPIGINQPIQKGLVGFVLKELNDLAYVYLVEMNHIVYVPTKVLDYLKLTDKDRIIDIERGDFIEVDGSLGIIFNVYDDIVIAFIPDFNDLVEVTDFTLLSVI